MESAANVTPSIVHFSVRQPNVFVSEAQGVLGDDWTVTQEGSIASSFQTGVEYFIYCFERGGVLLS